MKLSVSNIAWDPARFEEGLGLLRDLGCSGVEIAPSTLWKEPVQAGSAEISAITSMIKRYRLETPAFQALLYTRPELKLFGDSNSRKETTDYLKQLIRLAGQMEVRVLVLGSPRNRYIGQQSREECYALAVEMLGELGREAALYSTCLCIEPLNTVHTDFITSADEGYQLVSDVNHPNFGLHLDGRAMLESGEDFERVFRQYGGILKHFHVGDRDLSAPGSSGLDHSEIGEALSRSSYKGYVSIEMRRGSGEPQEVIKKAVAYVRDKYHIQPVPAFGKAS